MAACDRCKSGNHEKCVTRDSFVREFKCSCSCVGNPFLGIVCIVGMSDTSQSTQTSDKSDKPSGCDSGKCVLCNDTECDFVPGVNILICPTCYEAQKRAN